MKKFNIFYLMALCIAILNITNLWGQKKWDGGGGDGLWTTATNWDNDTAPTSSDDVIIDNTSVSGSYTVTLNAGTAQTVRSLQIGYSGNANTITLIVSGTTTNVLSLSGGGANALHITDRGVLNNQSGSSTRGIRLVNSSDVFKMSGTGKYIHATSSTASKIPQLTSGTTSSNYNLATTSTFELQTATFDSIPGYGIFRYNINATNSAGTSLTINGDLYVDQGTLGVGASTTNTFTIAGNVTIASGATFRGNSASSGGPISTINITGNVTGAGTFTGSSASTGTTNITAGGNITSIISFGTGTTNVTFSGGTASVNFTPVNGTTPSVKNITIASGKTVTYNPSSINLSIASGSTLTVNGTLNLGDRTVSGSGTFTIASGGTLGIGSTAGITSSGTTGNIQTTTRNFNTGANYTYNGSSAQNTGNGLPTTVNNLTINNSAGVTLDAITTVNGTLTLTSGLLTLGSNNLILGSSATVSGTSSASNMVVATGTGELRKTYTTTGSFTFPVGDNTGTAEYSPVTLNFTTGTFSSAYAAVKITNAKHPNNTSSNHFITRYWTVTSSGISAFSCNITLTYVDADVNGTESNIYNSAWNGISWSLLDQTNTSTNQLTGTVYTFSDFTGGEASALPIELISFSANIVKNSIQLNWSTATELNNLRFDVERSNDSQNFKKIGEVKGNGTTIQQNDYTFKDKNISSGNTYYYRLKQIDTDGSFRYSNVLNLSLNPSYFTLSQNFPNPFNPVTEISYTISMPGYVSLEVYNILGERVATLVSEGRAIGNYKVRFDASKISSGVYFYKLSVKSGKSGNFEKVRKMIVMK
jgi:hypothetical protein